MEACLLMMENTEGPTVEIAAVVIDDVAEAVIGDVVGSIVQTVVRVDRVCSGDSFATHQNWF